MSPSKLHKHPPESKGWSLRFAVGLVLLNEHPFLVGVSLVPFWVDQRTNPCCWNVGMSFFGWMDGWYIGGQLSLKWFLKMRVSKEVGSHKSYGGWFSSWTFCMTDRLSVYDSKSCGCDVYGGLGRELLLCLYVDHSLPHIEYVSGWWFQIFCYVHPYLGKWSNLTNIFQLGWNHQLVMYRT